jgi:hypothetical protein
MDSTQAFVLHYGEREFCSRCRELSMLLVALVRLDGTFANAFVYCANCDLMGPSPLVAAFAEPPRPSRWRCLARLVAPLRWLADVVRLRQR